MFSRWFKQRIVKRLARKAFVRQLDRILSCPGGLVWSADMQAGVRSHPHPHGYMTRETNGELALVLVLHRKGRNVHIPRLVSDEPVLDNMIPPGTVK